MALASALIINSQVPGSRRGISVSHLPLNIQQIGVVPDAINRIGVPELMWRQMANLGPLAQLAQILPHSPGGEAAPATPAMRDKQGIEGRWQGQIRAHLKPVFNVLCGLFMKDNGSILMRFPAPDEGRPMAFVNKNITGTQRSQFANPQPRIQRQRPQRQAAHVKPVTPAFIGGGLKVAKELLQFLTPRRAGQYFGMGRLFGKLDGVERQPSTFIEPGEPDFKRLVIAFDARFFEAAPLAIIKESVNGFRCGWPAVAGEVAKLVERGFVIKDGLFSLAGFGVQEVLNGPIKGIGVIKLNKC